MNDGIQEDKMRFAEVYLGEGLFEGEDEEETWNSTVVVGLESCVML